MLTPRLQQKVRDLKICSFWRNASKIFQSSIITSFEADILRIVGIFPICLLYFISYLHTK